jgi:hypothetical protein
MRAQFSVPASTPSQAYQHELNIRNLVTQHKTAELHTQTLLANIFYGHSPLNTTIGDYLARAQALDKTVTPRGPAYSTWLTSYKAAYSAQLLTAQIQFQIINKYTFNNFSSLRKHKNTGLPLNRRDWQRNSKLNASLVNRHVSGLKLTH